MAKKRKKPVAAEEALIELELDFRLSISTSISQYQKWEKNHPNADYNKLFKAFIKSLVADLQDRKIHELYNIDGAEFLCVEEK